MLLGHCRVLVSLQALISKLRLSSSSIYPDSKCGKYIDTETLCGYFVVLRSLMRTRKEISKLSIGKYIDTEKLFGYFVV